MGQGHVKMCFPVLSMEKMATIKRVELAVSSCAIYNRLIHHAVNIICYEDRSFYVIFNTVKLGKIFWGIFARKRQGNSVRSLLKQLSLSINITGVESCLFPVNMVCEMVTALKSKQHLSIILYR